MKTGYARVSTEDQNPELQLSALKKAGCRKIYIDKASGAHTKRLELAKCLKTLKAGDVLIVWKLDRLGRSLHDLIGLLDDLKTRGVAFRSVTEFIDTATPTGRAMWQLVGILAELLAEPPGETTHWTSRAMAAATGLAVSTVQKIWRSHGLQPHRIRSFKLSRDPEFAAKVRDVVGLYVEPPAHAVVLSVDETWAAKRTEQIQALDRTQPGLPMKRGRAGTMTHDYVRNGTTTLFAALNVLDGTVVGQCMARHRHQGFLRFLNRLERDIPAGKLVHVVLDTDPAKPISGSHKHPKVRAWLERHPRWTFHYTPTSASWLNAVETFFAQLTQRRLRRGVFHSLVDLQAAINRYLAEHNTKPKPFVWTAHPGAIIAAAKRGYQALDSIH